MQAVQIVSETSLQADTVYFPELHVVHAWQTVSAVELQFEETNDPGLWHVEHGWGFEFPPMQKLSPVQELHAEAPWFENVPIAHDEQAVSSPRPYVPAAQPMHAEFDQ